LCQLGTPELAATAFATMIIQVTGVIVWSLGDGLISLTSQAMGAGNRRLAGVWLQIALVMSVILSIPIAISWLYMGEILRIVRFPGSKAEDDRVIELAAQFGRLSTIWIVPDAITASYCQWVNGLDAVAATVGVQVAFVFYNIVANIVLVHGVHWGNFHLEGMGLPGSPIATASTTILRLVVLVWYMRDKLPKGVWNGFDPSEFTRDRWMNFLKQSIPNALIALLEQAQFIVMALMIAKFGEAQLAAHSAMMNVFDLFTAGIYGCMEGGAMKIGRALGASRLDAAKALGKYLLGAMTIMGVLVSLLFVVTRNEIGRVFSKDPEVIRYCSQLAVLSAATYVMIAVTFASYAVLQGQGRPSQAVVSMFVGVWLFGVPSAYAVAFPLEQGFLGVWEGAMIGYTVMTLVMCWQVYWSDWDALCLAARERSEVGLLPDQSPASHARLLASHRTTPSPSPAARGLGTTPIEHGFDLDPSAQEN